MANGLWRSMHSSSTSIGGPTPAGGMSFGSPYAVPSPFTQRASPGISRHSHMSMSPYSHHDYSRSPPYSRMGMGSPHHFSPPPRIVVYHPPTAVDAPIEFDTGDSRAGDVQDSDAITTDPSRRNAVQEAKALRGSAPPPSTSHVFNLIDLPALIKAGSMRTVESAWFDRFILLLITVNCALLSAQTARQDEDAIQAVVLDYAEYVFAAVFSLEMLIKMIAYGLVKDEYGYFRSGWNWIDFAIVCEIWFSTAVGGDGGGNLSSIRSIRALRPLRSIKMIPELHVLVDTLIGSLPMLFSTLVLCLFVFVLFGLIGMELFRGAFRGRCFDLDTGLLVESDERLCGGRHECGTNQFCAAWVLNPDADIIAYDNMLLALTTNFMAITLEGWSQTMYYAMDSFHTLAPVYFMFLILLGAFVVLNLWMAVVMSKFKQSQQAQAQEDLDKEWQEQKRLEAMIERQQRQETKASRRRSATAFARPGSMAAAAESVREQLNSASSTPNLSIRSSISSMTSANNSRASKLVKARRRMTMVLGTAPKPPEEDDELGAPGSTGVSNRALQTNPIGESDSNSTAMRRASTAPPNALEPSQASQRALIGKHHTCCSIPYNLLPSPQLFLESPVSQCSIAVLTVALDVHMLSLSEVFHMLPF